MLFEGNRDYAGAIEAWERLMAQRLGDTDADRVAQAILEARARVAAASDRGRPRAESSRTITGTITVAPVLGGRVPPSGVLFVIARQGGGAQRVEIVLDKAY